MDDAQMYEERIVVIPTCEYLRKILIIIHIIVPADVRYTVKHLMKLLAIRIIFGGPFLFGVLGFIYKGLKDGRIVELHESFFYVLNYIFLVFNDVWYMLRANEIDSYLQASDTYRFGIPQTVRNRRKIFSIFSTSLIFLVNLITFVFLIVTHFTYCSRNFSEFCDLGYPAWYPFGINKYLTTYFVIARAVYMMYSANTLAFFPMVPELVLNIASRIRHLQYLLRCFRFEGNPSLEKKKLQFCIRYHTEILGLIDSYNDTMGYFVSYPMGIGIIPLCALLEYGVVFTRSSSSALFLFLWLTTLFMQCECGNVTTEEVLKGSYSFLMYMNQLTENN